jgi:hypothetical protein
MKLLQQLICRSLNKLALHTLRNSTTNKTSLFTHIYEERQSCRRNMEKSIMIPPNLRECLVLLWLILKSDLCWIYLTSCLELPGNEGTMVPTESINPIERNNNKNYEPISMDWIFWFGCLLKSTRGTHSFLKKFYVSDILFRWEHVVVQPLFCTNYVI